MRKRLVPLKLEIRHLNAAIVDVVSWDIYKDRETRDLLGHFLEYVISNACALQVNEAAKKAADQLKGTKP